MIMVGPESIPMNRLLAAALNHVPGKPRYVALGNNAPERSRDTRERLEFSMSYVMADPESFMDAVESLGVDCIVASPCSARSLLSLIQAAVLTQVPLLAVCRLAPGSDLRSILGLAAGDDSIEGLLEAFAALNVRCKIDSDMGLEVETVEEL